MAPHGAFGSERAPSKYAGQFVRGQAFASIKNLVGDVPTFHVHDAQIAWRPWYESLKSLAVCRDASKVATWTRASASQA
jgi:hypothetical protein